MKIKQSNKSDIAKEITNFVVGWILNPGLLKKATMEYRLPLMPKKHKIAYTIWMHNISGSDKYSTLKLELLLLDERRMG